MTTLVPELIIGPFVGKATELIHRELDMESEWALKLADENSCHIINVFTQENFSNARAIKEIKERIKGHRVKVATRVLEAAQYIETALYQEEENKIDKSQIRDVIKSKIKALFKTKRQFTGSYLTLTTCVSVFKGILEIVANEVNDKFQERNLSNGARINAMMRHAIITYEITNFAINYIKNFSIGGIDEFVKMKDQVFLDLNIEDQKDRAEIIRLESRKDPNEQVYLERANGRIEGRKAIKAKWHELLEEMKSKDNSIAKIKGITDKLDIMRNDAERNIKYFETAGITMTVENSIKIIKQIEAQLDFGTDMLNYETTKFLYSDGINNSAIN